jgi:hypothetical protein
MALMFFYSILNPSLRMQNVAANITTTDAALHYAVDKAAEHVHYQCPPPTPISLNKQHCDYKIIAHFDLMSPSFLLLIV